MGGRGAQGGLGPVSLPPSLRRTGRELPTQGTVTAPSFASFSLCPGAACRSVARAVVLNPFLSGLWAWEPEACATPHPQGSGLEGLELAVRGPGVGMKGDRLGHWGGCKEKKGGFGGESILLAWDSSGTCRLAGVKPEGGESALDTSSHPHPPPHPPHTQHGHQKEADRAQ